MAFSTTYFNSALQLYCSCLVSGAISWYIGCNSALQVYCSCLVSGAISWYIWCNSAPQVYCSCLVSGAISWYIWCNSALKVYRSCLFSGTIFWYIQGPYPWFSRGTTSGCSARSSLKPQVVAPWEPRSSGLQVPDSPR